MADTVDITAGTGTKVSTEEVTTLNGASVTAQHLQRTATAVVTADGVAKDLLLGRNSDATSLSAALSTEDVALVGALTETAPATDTASSGLNGRLQRIAQRLTSLIALLPTALGANGGLKVEGIAGGVAQPVSIATAPVLVAGSAIIGKVGVDQTTPGTTDSVSVATAQGAGAAIGATTGAAVVTDANGTIQQYLRGLVKLWIAGLAAGEAHVGQVGGTTLLATGTMTRPSDTTAYAAGDGVTTATSSASAMTVTGAARIAAGSGVIFGGVAEKSTTSTTNAQFRIWIYQATPTAIPNDNAAFTAATHADYQKLVATAVFDFAAGIVGSDGVRVPIALERQNAAFKIASGSDLVVIWEARAAYTPGNAEVFRLALDISQD